MLLHWADENFETVFFLDSNKNILDKYKRFDLVLACGCLQKISPEQNAIQEFKDLENTSNDWLFGVISYDLKNEIEALSSNNFDGIEFPNLYFIQPKYVFTIANDILSIHHFETDISELWNEIQEINIPIANRAFSISLQQKTSKESYIKTVEKIQEDIKQGVVYEMNYCIEFYAEDCPFYALPIFEALNEKANAPFSGFVKTANTFILSASPERYIQRSANKLISQPIKGTAKRGKTKIEDNNLIEKLKNDTKERSENIMIVDLVRNDFHRFCETFSVNVEELCQIYSFDTVHQMISTIAGKISAQTKLSDCLLHTFPMGSMTGAPKISAMQLIEQYETTKRGIYSGSIGYITPNKDFDFNVVIRSMVYNRNKKYLSIQIGSAITIDSQAEKEYEECLLKAEALIQVLKN